MKLSPTLALNQRIHDLRASGRDVFNLGFGESGLPVHPELAEALSTAAHANNSYGAVLGSPEAREAAAAYFTKTGLATAPEQVVLGPGSKALLFALLRALDGDVVMPAPSWVTYAAQAALMGKHVTHVPIPQDAGGLPDPDLLEPALKRARAEGQDPRILIMTVPDNPTGTVPAPDLVRAVCDIAEQNGMFVVSDEIYRDLTFTPDALVPSPATTHPGNSIVTTGLSKIFALGGWRVGVLRAPDGPAGEELVGTLASIGSELWSCLAVPMQKVLITAYSGSPALEAHLESSRRLHQSVVRQVHADLVAAGVLCRQPQAGFYLYPDLAPAAESLRERGLDDATKVSDYLLEQHGLGVIAGKPFGDTPDSLRFRVSTSLLYGDVEQQWSALGADDPLSLPHIAGALERIRGAFGDLMAT